MEQIARVKQVLPDGKAQVVRIPEENCRGNCALCGGCGEETPFLVYNDIAAKENDRVILQPDGKAARKTAALLYTVPVILLLLGFLLGEHLFSKGMFCGLLGGVIGLWIVMLLDKAMTKQDPIVYHITGLAEDAAPEN